MPYRLVTETRSGLVEGPVFPRYTDALGEAVKLARNGLPFAQAIYDGSGDLVKRIEAEPRRVKLRPQVVGFESGSVVTPGLSPMGGTFELVEGV